MVTPEQLFPSHPFQVGIDVDEFGFLNASCDPSKINALTDRLKQNGLWGKYEDRFSALVKASNKLS